VGIGFVGFGVSVWCLSTFKPGDAMTDKQLASQLDLIERAYLVLSIWAEDYNNVDPDHQKVIDDLQREIKRITKELERKPAYWMHCDGLKTRIVFTPEPGAVAMYRQDV
jgi:hypothetical protein